MRERSREQGMYIYPYNHDWPHDFQEEAKLIRSIYVGSIQLNHIGSTAVEGLCAKNCIDILGVVTNLEDVRENLQNLERIGYHHKGSYGIEGRAYFSKQKRKVHFHIFPVGHHAIRTHLGFVETMCANPSLVQKLNKLKTQLHSKYPQDKDAYQKEKAVFYAEIQKKL
ncbi:hypothetical protein GCM10008090_31990 [Arenicella chitinivorans]|uniref:GrpB family protein n=1 Tax=Arenicella chitinivorans TaxID=1329800 RepID=A0A918VSY3_9GAMM|nr:GrpB family protein [Arenicella chitinivorans]GHA19854.1 hypothetical protein GCM10008090_31990 [Arenicella chitinivorans]